MADLCVQFVYMWVSAGRGAESVSFDDESFGDVGEVWSNVWDVALGDVMVCGKEVRNFRN